MCEARRSAAGARARGKSIVVLAALFAAVLLVSVGAAQAQTYLVDTGPGASDGSNGTGLFSTGNLNCSPQPACSQSFQNWAGQFTLTHAATLDGVEAWMGGYRHGSIAVKIYSDAGGIPGTSIFSQTYTFAPVFANYGWLSFPNYNVVLAAGVYWLALEPVPGTATDFGGMYGGAASPLPRYAVWNESSAGYRAIAGLLSFGMRISGSNFDDLAFGAAGRATMAGSTFGFPFSDDNTAGGAGQVSVFEGAGELPAGWSIVRAGLIQNGLSTGSWSGASICLPSYEGCTAASGAGRSVAFRTFTNPTAASVTVGVNAVIDGSFSAAGGGAASATGRVYVFDSTMFSDTVAAAGPDSGRFLLNSVPISQDLGTLFAPAALLASASQTLTGPANQPLTASLTTNLVTVAPQQSITVMFDVSVSTPSGSVADFFSTMAPAAALFTDQNGAPATQLVAVGPAAPTPTAAANLVLTPATASAPVGTTATVTATATDAGGAPVPGAAVYFSIASGPDTGASAVMIADANGQASFTYADAGGAGTDVIQAHIGSLQSNTVQQTWTTPGALDHITISPTSSTITSGASQAYTTQGFDVFSNSLGAVTSTTTFTITPDGSCTGATCTATTAGSHTVTATCQGKTATASLAVTAGGGTFPFRGFFAPVNNPPVVNVMKAGLGVPVRFNVGGFHGFNVFAAGSPTTPAMQCVAGAPTDPVEITIPLLASVLVYDPLTSNYVYFWKTDKSWANSCRQLTIKLTDGTTHTANFRFTK